MQLVYMSDHQNVQYLYITRLSDHIAHDRDIFPYHLLSSTVSHASLTFVSWYYHFVDFQPFTVSMYYIKWSTVDDKKNLSLSDRG